MPLVRPRRSAPGSCASRAPGGTAARTWPRRRSSRFPTRRRPWSRRTRSREQSLALAADLPERPIVLGGCCCAHVGAVEGLAARARPPRRRLARRARRPQHARDLAERQRVGDAARGCCSTRAPWRPRTRCWSARGASIRRRQAFIAASGLRTAEGDLEDVVAGRGRRLRRVRRRRARPGEAVAVHMAEPGGPTLAEAEAMLERIAPDAAAWRARASPGRRPIRGTPSRSPGCARRARPVTTPRRSKIRRLNGEPDRRLDRAPRSRAGRRRQEASRTRARAAGRTTATTSSSARCGSARSAATTSPSRRASGSPSSPTRARSPRRTPTCAPPIRSASSTCAPTRSGSPRPR